MSLDPKHLALVDQMEAAFKSHVGATKTLIIQSLYKSFSEDQSPKAISEEMDAILMSLCLVVLEDVTKMANQ
jgi:hypothetical protein